MTMRSGLLAKCALLFVCACATDSGYAQQDYPTKPIRMIVGVAPSGATDILARTVGVKLAEVFKQQVVVENRPGANHIIGGEITARSPKDGHTLQMIPEGFVINASVYAKLPFDPIKDFQPLAIVALVPNVLTVHPSLPVRNVKQFIALARSRPGQLSYGSSSVGSPSHMAGELFAVMAKLNYVHVPYKGQSLALIDLMGGHIQFLFPSIPSSVQHIRSGRLVALGVTTAQRATALPDVASIAEAGLTGYEVSGWYGVVGPAGLPPAVVARLNKEINAIIQVPETKKQMTNEGAEPRSATPEEFGATMARDLQKWAKVVAAAGIQVQK
ncbi:MAG: tripartite tricarboxylate transporter substrate binding protein [Betaproteobacteria bacterium]|nr:tripartite tricarboxylate transporter substrate binding protein [Betaproteobacteria bacterium]